jgi:Uma2 family endonuclease
MAQQASLVEPERMVVHTGPVIQMDDEQLFQFCRINRDLQIERNEDGDIIIFRPDGAAPELDARNFCCNLKTGPSATAQA